LLDQKARNDPVGDLQDGREQLRMCSEQQAKRDRKREHRVPAGEAADAAGGGAIAGRKFDGCESVTPMPVFDPSMPVPMPILGASTCRLVTPPRNYYASDGSPSAWQGVDREFQSVVSMKDQQIVTTELYLSDASRRLQPKVAI
jgi:hypothetical protein